MTKLPSILCCAIILAYGCKDTSKIDKDLVYSTLNDIIQQDSIFAWTVCSKFDQVTIPNDIQKEYFNKDKNFIQEQLKKSLNAKVDTGRIFIYSQRKKGIIKSFIDTTCSINIFYRFTYPIFSRDLQTVVVGVTEDCNCMLGGWGFEAVYKRHNGKWVRIKKYESWIS
jgi:hypothetical protein